MTYRTWRNVLLGLALTLLPVLAAPQLRVMTFNVTKYNGGRIPEFQTILFDSFEGRRAAPDVFIGQEFLNVTAATTFRNLMNAATGSPGDYALATFVDGPDTDSVLIYRTSRVQLLQVVTVSVGGNAPKHPRNVMRYDLRLQGYTGLLAELSVYSSHMKAGSTQTDRDRRLNEAQVIRANAQTLGGRPFLIGGDFNIQSSGEMSYVELTGSQVNNDGQFFDPIRTPGNWNKNSTFRFVHTQDPATTMDDRFDFLLVSRSLVDQSGMDYKGNPFVSYSLTTWNDPNHTYRAWGNDGTSYNTALKIPGNTMVGPTIAQALVTAANGLGHIPVFMDVLVPARVGSQTVIDFGTVGVKSVVTMPLTVANTGDVSLWGPDGISPLKYSLSTSGPFLGPLGNFAASAGGNNQHPIQVDTSTPGLKVGTVTIASDSPDEPSRVVTLRANVVAPSLFKPFNEVR